MTEGKDMALLRLKYVMAQAGRSGKIAFYYFRRKGHPKISLPGLPGSAEFMAAYNECLKAANLLPALANDRNSFIALLDGYYRSQEYKKLNVRSQKVRKQILERFAKDNGTKPYAQMERRHVLGFRDDMADRPGAATNLIKALRSVFNYALEYDLVKVNPAAQVDYLRSKGTGFHSWTIEEVRQFEATHEIGTKPRLALALLLYTGQRRSDVVTFGKQMVRGGRLHYSQQKTGKPMTTRIIAPLRHIIDATPSSNLAFLETSHGMPYTANGFGNAMRDWCNEAGLKHCSAHGLRKALGARLAELGATAKQIQNTLGHETLAQASLYTKAADEQIGSDAALELFENTIAQHGAQHAKRILK